MRIDRLNVKNFRLFEEQEFSFHPQFNLIVGVNGSGKTTVLRLLTVSMNQFMEDLAGFNRGCKLIDDDILTRVIVNNLGESRAEKVVPVSLTAFGNVRFLQSEALTSDFSVNNTYWGIYNHEDKISSEHGFTIPSISKNWPLENLFIAPLIVFYPCNRLWRDKKSTFENAIESAIKAKYSRRDGYNNWTQAQADSNNLVEWLLKQNIIAFQEGTESLGWRILNQALKNCFEGFEKLSFMAKEGDLVVHRIDKEGKSYRQLFKQMSDGERCMIGLIGDMVRRAVLLNPQLGDEILEKTAGVVLIDELDLHLHPTWQRRIIDDLRKTFPKVQFICTTHSPFLIQSLRSGEELLMLDGQPTAQLANKTIEEIARGIMGVEHPEVAVRYEEMKEVAKHYLQELEEAKLSPQATLEAYKQRLAEGIAPYADNPAFQAFLEMKRVVKLGE